LQEIKSNRMEEVGKKEDQVVSEENAARLLVGIGQPKSNSSSSSSSSAAFPSTLEVQPEKPSSTSTATDPFEEVAATGNTKSSFGVSSFAKKEKISDDVRNDVMDDVIKPSRKPEWKDEIIEAIPQFSCVEDNVMDIEQWCDCALRLTSQFSGPDCVKIRTLRKVIPIPEFRARDVDLTQFTVSTFLAKVVIIWKETVGSSLVKAVLHRRSGQSWTEFRKELITWASSHGFPSKDEWLLAQLKKSTDLPHDFLGAAVVSSEQWARMMDRAENMYGHGQTQSVGAVASEQATDETIDAIKGADARKKGRALKPVRCYLCGKEGHIKRNCPKLRSKRQWNRK